MRRFAAALLCLGALFAAVGARSPGPFQSPLPGSEPSYANLAYIGDGNPAHRLDLYVPAQAGPRPLVVYIHGGSWAFGDKSMRPGLPSGYDTLVRLLLRNGYAVASINYRFSREAVFPAQLDDARAAIGYLKANAAAYRLNPKRFVAAGDSAGGQIALLLGLAPPATIVDSPTAIYASTDVRAVVSYYGVTDLGGIFADRMDANCPNAKNAAPATSAEGRLVGGDPRQGRAGALATKGSPITYAGPQQQDTGAHVPVLLFHGTQDCIVPLAQAQRLHERLQASGDVVQLETIRAGHAWSLFFSDPGLQNALLDFLRRYDA